MSLDAILDNPVAIPVAVAALAFVVGLPLVIADAVRKRSREKARAQMIEKARLAFVAYRQAVEKLGSLPEVKTSLLMKRDEFCYYSCTGSVLYEVRSVRTSSYAGVSQGLGHGLRIGGGNSRSTSHDNWRALSTGTLVMTNRRVYFNGDKQDRNVALGEIMAIDYSATTIELSCEKRQRSMVFSVGNGYIANYILRLLVSNINAR